MRKLRIFEHISLDGVIQTSSEDGFTYPDWTAPYRTPVGFSLVLEMQGENFDLLLGRKTYDLWSAYWPKVQGNPMGDRLNAATKFIVTHRPESLEWGPVQGISGIEDVRKIKSQGDKDLVMWGSSTLTSTLLEQGLVDEVNLLMYPVLVGKGKRFFKDGTAAGTLALQNSKAFPSGIVANTYKFVGPLVK
jgi:dihydrofolate reductase